jgi:hypothetical protein
MSEAVIPIRSVPSADASEPTAKDTIIPSVEAFQEKSDMTRSRVLTLDQFSKSHARGNISENQRTGFDLENRRASNAYEIGDWWMGIVMSD